MSPLIPQPRESRTASPYVATLTVDRYLHGVRIDSLLVRHFRNYTPYRMQRMVRAGLVRIAGEVVPIERRVFEGETVEIRLIDPPDKVVQPEPIPVNILFEDEWLIVVNKPADMAVHPVGEFQNGTLANALQHHVDQHSPQRGLIRPGFVHRLDRETSGALVAAKDHLAHRRLSIDFQKGRVRKAYQALVEGVIAVDRGEINLPIGRLPSGDSVLMSADPAARDAKPAHTSFEVVQRWRNHTLVRAEPHTGRNHQIRVHFAATGHPVVGDEFYTLSGDIKIERAAYRDQRRERSASNDSPLVRHALHAERLEFEHPINRTPLSITAPLPSDILHAISLLE